MRVFLAIMVVSLLAAASSARAADFGDVARLGPGYVHEDGRTNSDFTWDQPFHIVGYVSGFEGRLAHLDAAEPGIEYTWAVMDALSCGGILGDTAEGCPVLSNDAAGGWFRLVRDTTPDANLADPATFTDGEVLLEGVIPRWEEAGSTAPLTLVGWYCSPTNEGSEFWFRASLDGGAAWPDLGVTGPETLAMGLGTFEAWSQLPQEILDAGYFARVEFTLSTETPVAVEPSSWGRVKQLYH